MAPWLLFFSLFVSEMNKYSSSEFYPGAGGGFPFFFSLVN